MALHDTSGFDWIYETFVKNPSSDYAVIRSSTRENKFLPPDFVKRLEEQYSTQWQKQEIEGQFCDLEALCLSEAGFRLSSTRPKN